MRTPFTSEEALEYCNELTKNGEKLAVTWEGGNDSGFYTVLVNDKELDWQDERVDRLVQFIDEEIGYGSFAGDFSTDGSLEFIKEQQCFQGFDCYMGPENDIGECDIHIDLTTDIWFDEVRLHIDSDEDHNDEIRIELVVNNGPLTKKHAHLEKKATESFSTEIEAFIQENTQVKRIWYQHVIPRGLFTKKGKKLRHIIKEIPFSYDHVDERPVIISLN